MADIEKKLLSDLSEHWDQKKQIDAKVNALDKRSTDFIAHVESLGEQKATQEVIAEIENKEKFALTLDNQLEQEKSDLSHTVGTRKINIPSSFSNLSVASLIESKNPDSNPLANIWRAKSYTTIQSQISTLPFGLDTFFADA
jgi:hypothetical protein